MSLQTPVSIRTLRRKLYRKTLAPAKAGGRSFERIEAAGLEDWLARLGEELRAKAYRCQPVRRVMIPKPGGGERPLGIPTWRA